MSKIIKSRIFTFVLGAVIFSGITGVAAYSMFAKDIKYTPSDTTWKKSNGDSITNVEDAIDELYENSNALKTSDLKSSVQYKNDRAGENTAAINNLSKGKYMCFYVHNAAGTTTTKNFRSVTDINKETGCDDTEILYSKNYSTGGASVISSNQYISYARQQILFTCTLNTDKSIAITVDYGSNGYGLPADSTLDCMKIGK